MGRRPRQGIARLAIGLVVLGLLLTAVGLAMPLYSRWQVAQEKAQLQSHLSRPVSVERTPRAFRAVVLPLAETPTPAPSSNPGRASPATVQATSTAEATPVPSLVVSREWPTSASEPPALPVRLRIPALGVDTPVVLARKIPVPNGPPGVYTWETVDYAAGYHEGTALPGERGNVVISGHNNIKGAVFRPLSLLGDPDVPFPYGIPVYITDARGRVFVYRFEAIYKVREAGASWAERVENARFVAPTAEPVLTLITCWPVTGNAYRLIVRARFAGVWEAVVPAPVE